MAGDSMTLDWDPVTGATGYRVERANRSSGPWNAIATLSAADTLYVDSGLAAGTEYYYRLFATNSLGDSPASIVLRGETGPASVTDLGATPASYFEIDLSWTDSAGGTLFHLERRPAGGSNWSRLASIPSGVGTYRDTGLQPSESWDYQITAVSAANRSSAPSGIASATTDAYNITLHFNQPLEHISLRNRRAFQDIASAGTTRIAVGSQGIIARSTNGSQWEFVDQGPINTLAPLTSVAHGNGIWVTVGSDVIMRSIDDGLTWQAVSGFSGLSRKVIYDGSQFVAVSYDGTNPGGSVHTSTDGSSWNTTSQFSFSTTTPLITEAVDYVFHDNLANRYVILTSMGRVLTASSVAGPWTERRAPGPDFFSGLVDAEQANFGIVAVDWGGNWIFSPDGLSWNTTSLGGGFLSYLSEGNGLILGSDGSSYRTTTDGLSWTVPQPFDLDLDPADGYVFGHAEFSGGSWILAGNHGNIVLTSSDGLHWNEVTRVNVGGSFGDFRAITYHDSAFFAASNERIWRSTDLLNWQEVHFSTSANYADMFTAEGEVYVFGRANSGGAIGHVSADGFNWTALNQTGGLATAVLAQGATTDLVEGQRRWAAVGNGQVYMSGDGRNWIYQSNAPINQGLVNISGSSEGMIAGGSSGALYATREGVVWQAAPETLFDLPATGLGYWYSTVLNGRTYFAGRSGQIVSVVLDDAPPANGPFEQFASAVFPEANTASALPGGDWDGDGVFNFVEFFLGLDALTGDRSAFTTLTTPTRDPVTNALSLNLTVRVDERISVRMETSDTLETGSWTDTHVNRVDGVPSGGFRTIQFSVPGTASERRFSRLIFRFDQSVTP